MGNSKSGGSKPPAGSSRTGYWEWEFSGPAPNHRYLVPAVVSCLPKPPQRLIDLGCGNGALSSKLQTAGMIVTGIEGTESGVDRARQAYPDVTFIQHELGTPLPDTLQGQFDVVVSAEVIEHLFFPRELFARAREALGSSGMLLVTTPFHGYWKNLALSISGKMDAHHQATSDYGHIKFFSERTLGELAEKCGFRPIRFVRAGRIRPLESTMVLVAELLP